MEVAVLVPVKGLDTAKQRLGPHLSTGERARLARFLADGVLHSCRALAVVVVCDDDEIAEWATASGVGVHVTTATDLNGAVEDGIDAVAAAGFDHVTVAHADLAFPRSLGGVARPSTITLVPDRRRRGTNVMSFPVAHRLGADYGPGSFARHLAAAQRLVDASADTLSVEVRADSDLAFDIDTVDDLSHPRIGKVLPPWLQTNPDNPSTT